MYKRELHTHRGPKQHKQQHNELRATAADQAEGLAEGGVCDTLGYQIRIWIGLTYRVCVIPFYTRKRVSSTQHGYKSTSVYPLRHMGIVSDSEARR